MIASAMGVHMRHYGPMLAMGLLCWVCMATAEVITKNGDLVTTTVPARSSMIPRIVPTMLSNVMSSIASKMVSSVWPQEARSTAILEIPFVLTPDKRITNISLKFDYEASAGTSNAVPVGMGIYCVDNDEEKTLLYTFSGPKPQGRGNFVSHWTLEEHGSWFSLVNDEMLQCSGVEVSVFDPGCKMSFFHSSITIIMESIDLTPLRSPRVQNMQLSPSATISQFQPTLFEDQLEQSSDSEEESSDSEERCSASEEQSSDAEERCSASEEQSSDSEERCSDSEERCSDSEEQISDSEERCSASEEQSSDSEERCSASEEQSSVSAEQSSVSEEIAANHQPQDRPKESISTSIADGAQFASFFNAEPSFRQDLRTDFSLDNGDFIGDHSVNVMQNESFPLETLQLSSNNRCQDTATRISEKHCDDEVHVDNLVKPLQVIDKDPAKVSRIPNAVLPDEVPSVPSEHEHLSTLPLKSVDSGFPIEAHQDDLDVQSFTSTSQSDSESRTSNVVDTNLQFGSDVEQSSLQRFNSCQNPERKHQVKFTGAQSEQPLCTNHRHGEEAEVSKLAPVLAMNEETVVFSALPIGLLATPTDLLQASSNDVDERELVPIMSPAEFLVRRGVDDAQQARAIAVSRPNEAETAWSTEVDGKPVGLEAIMLKEEKLSRKLPPAEDTDEGIARSTEVNGQSVPFEAINMLRDEEQFSTELPPTEATDERIAQSTEVEEQSVTTETFNVFCKEGCEEVETSEKQFPRVLHRGIVSSESKRSEHQVDDRIADLSSENSDGTTSGALAATKLREQRFASAIDVNKKGFLSILAVTDDFRYYFLGGTAAILIVVILSMIMACLRNKRKRRSGELIHCAGMFKSGTTKQMDNASDSEDVDQMFGFSTLSQMQRPYEDRTVA